MRRQVIFAVGTFLLTAALLIYTFVAGNEPFLGLDLQGGASVVFEPTTPVDGGRLEQAIDIMNDRVNDFGAREPEIYEQGGNIVVELPGIDDQEAALDLVGQTAELRFRAVTSLELPPSVLDLATTTTTVDGDATTTTSAGDATTTSVDGDATTTTDAPASTPTTRSAARQVDPDETTTTTAADDESTTTTAPDTATDETTTTFPLVTDTTPAVGASGTADATAPLGTRDRCLADLAVRDPDAVGSSELGIAPVDPETGITPDDADLPCDEVVLPEIDPDTGTVTRLYRLGPTQFTGTVVAGAEARLQSAEWSVQTQLKGGAAGRDLFNEAAAACYNLSVGCPYPLGQDDSGLPHGGLAFVLDGEVISAPTFQAPFFDGDVFISGAFDEGRAKDLARLLRYGALPVELVPQTTQIVSATVGEDALDAGILAGVVGLSLVALFMLLYYRGLGVVAVVSLLVAIGLTWVVVAWLGETQGLTITLAGVTGLIVSIGIAVDSNIVYFEHLKEDVRNGRSVRSSVDRSFPAAFSTILKADSASLIGAGLLYWLTIGAVKGFALYLGLATVIDLVVTYFFLGPLVRIVARHKSFAAHPDAYGIPTPREAV